MKSADEKRRQSLYDLNAIQPLRCPKCHGSLDFQADAAACAACGQTYRQHAHGYFDLRPDDRRYQDFILTSEAGRAHWVQSVALTEGAGAQHMMESYLVPLLRRLGFQAGADVLSVGCGGAWDVLKLHALGYRAWGVDNGGRVVAWQGHPQVQYLALGDALRLPYADGSFDFVFSEGVIEHIGYVGDVSQPMPDWQAQRQQFARELARVTRPGGYILVGCPNRLFPIDFFHGGKAFHGFTLRFHPPREPFLLSYGDIRSLFQPLTREIKPLSLQHFFNLARLAAATPWLRLPIALVETIFGSLPGIFWRSALTPYVVALVRK